MDHLTQQEKDICRQCGVSEEDYLATKKEEIQAALNAEKAMTESDAKERIMRTMGLSPEDVKKMEEEEEKRRAAEAPLTDEELKVCRLLGITPLDYFAARGQETAVNHQAIPNNSSKTALNNTLSDKPDLVKAILGATMRLS